MAYIRRVIDNDCARGVVYLWMLFISTKLTLEITLEITHRFMKSLEVMPSVALTQCHFIRCDDRCRQTLLFLFGVNGVKNDLFAVDFYYHCIKAASVKRFLSIWFVNFSISTINRFLSLDLFFIYSLRLNEFTSLPRRHSETLTFEHHVVARW